ncbi:MAG TPA: oxalate/formate MFS antiporter [Burkholderiales bacterium]|nr:oxalate/formate MFS antiporter [Burkholderiales bacterium]
MRDATNDRRAQPAVANRWVQLAVAVACMCMIANLQYGWTLFVNPIEEKHGWGRAAIQVAFSIFVILETWAVPVEGWCVDRFGPRVVALAGGVLCAAAWALNSVATSLPMLYFAAALGGIGAGAVYGTCVGNTLKWFARRRGLAAGLTAAGFGAGSALTVIPIAATIKAHGYEAAFLYFGLAQGAAVVLLALFLQSPPLTPAGASRGNVTELAADKHFTPAQMVATPVFWVMYLMFIMMAAGGLMATAQLGPIAKDFRIADVPVTLLGLTLPALTFALSLDRILNGLTRPFFGWVSDRIGREHTMFIAFALEGFGILLLARLGQDPLWFVVLSALVFFAWGEIYSLFPATCADSYGTRYAAANAGLLYTAKGTAALLVPFTSVMAAGGAWHKVFAFAAVLNFAAALLALLVLKPMRTRMSVRAISPPGARRLRQT